MSSEEFSTAGDPSAIDVLTRSFPDRQACLVAAAHAAAQWARARRALWDESPALRQAQIERGEIRTTANTNAPAGTNASALALDSAVAEALMSALALDSTPSEETTPPVASGGWGVESLARALDTTPEAAHRVTADHDAMVWRQESEKGFEPDTNGLFTSAPAPSIGSIVVAAAAAWTRALAGNVLSRWSQVAMVAALLVIGMAGRAYWPFVTASKSGTAVLESVPDGSQVVVDGKVVGTTPLTTQLSAGSHAVEFRFRKTTRTVRINVAAGGRAVERIDWTRKPSGRLQVHTDPPGAKVSVDGVARGVTPLTVGDLTAGTHAVVLERADGSIERMVTVSATELTRVDEMIFPGWITVFSPFNLNITEGSRPIRLDDRHQVMLPAGSHELRFENRALRYEEVRHVDVRAGGITPLSVIPPRSTLTVTATSPAEVWLDGASAGPTPLNAVPVELGTREIVVRTANGDERRFAVTVTTSPVTLDVNFSKPSS